MKDTPPGHYDDLDAVREEIRSRLVRGVRDRRSAFHLMGLATVDEAGRPRLRTVVLRAASHDLSEVGFHTDARSAKARELAASPACALLLYDPRACVQLRIEGTARLHREDSLALSAWENSTPHARLCYAVEPAPGSVLEDPASAAFLGDEARVRERFVRAVVAVERIEWLYLRASGHRRADFVRERNQLHARWLVP